MEILLIGIAILLGLVAGGALVYRYKSVQLKKIDKQQLDDYQVQLSLIESKLLVEKELLKSIESDISTHMQQLENTIKQETSIVETILEREKRMMEESLYAYVETLDLAYNESEIQFDEKISLLKEELEKLKAARDANIQASLRELELKEKENFYKVSLSDADLSDISILENIKPKLRKPEILSKLIWTTYYQKGVNTLCSNVLKDRIVTGIYKITDTTTDMAYIGQSVDIAKRWKEHIKAALGASSTSSSNKLYAAMQASGIHNFTFEILEEVPAARLNESERYYINFYQSNVYGLNTVRGTAR